MPAQGRRGGGGTRPVTQSQRLWRILAGMTAAPPNADREALKAHAILGTFFVAATLIAYFAMADWRAGFPRDGSTLVIGRDFLNFWMYGRAAWMPEPGQWYDVVAYQRELAALVGNGYPGQNWSYPPSIMLLTAPFGSLGYLPALLLWTLLGLAAFVPVVWRYLTGRHALIAALFAPAAILGLISGQISFFATAIMLGAFAWLDRRPIAAGVLIGLLTIKPQLGVLFPVMLIASGRWRVFAAASATALALVVVSAWLFGGQAWIDFFTRGLPVQNLVLSDPEGITTPYFPTVFMNLRGVGLGYDAAMAVQFAFAAVAAAIVAWAFRYRANADARQLEAIFYACSILAVPYMLSYGTIALALAALALLQAGTLDARGRLLVQLVYWLPLIQIGLGTFDIPGPALIPFAFAGYLAMRLKNTPAAAPAALLRPA